MVYGLNALANFSQPHIHRHSESPNYCVVFIFLVGLAVGVQLTALFLEFLRSPAMTVKRCVTWDNKAKKHTQQ